MSATDELYRHHTEGQTKFVYFMLGLSASAIAFSIHETRTEALSWMHLPFGLALACWSFSFFAGIKGLGWRQSMLGVNMTMTQFQDGTGRYRLSEPNRTDMIEEIRDKLDGMNDTVAKWFGRQQTCLLAGAILYVAGHVSGMAARAHFL